MINRIQKGALDLGIRFIPESVVFDKDMMRQKYIGISNELIRKKHFRYPPGRILLLLPRCIQNADCIHKVTLDINECRECGHCQIGMIKEMSIGNGIATRVVSGGTAARFFVKDCRPELIVAVACERELMSGMQDVRGIPVIGIINQRPNGQCYNTAVDMDLLQEHLANILILH